MKKRIWVLTLFPDFFKAFTDCGVIGQVLRNKRELKHEFEFKIVDIRDYALNKYKSVDDTPFGGGPGMVMKADVLFNALDKGVREPAGHADFEKLYVIYTSPRGDVWDRDECHQFSQKYLQISEPSLQQEIVFICGRYEGIDERFLESYVDRFISIGDYVLTGGELAVMSILDSSFRFIDGVLGNEESYQQDSFENGLIEYPQYTRPRDFQGVGVPEELVSGHHKKIQEYQLSKQEELTKKHRPDLWEKYQDKEKIK